MAHVALQILVFAGLGLLLFLFIRRGSWGCCGGKGDSCACEPSDTKPTAGGDHEPPEAGSGAAGSLSGHRHP